MSYQGYLEIKYKSMTDDELAEFKETLKAAGVDFYRIDTGNDEYYHCLIEDIGVLESLLKELSGRSPVLNGVWDKHGIPKGKLKDAKTKEITGNAEYTFNLDKHKKHSKKYDAKGNEEEVTEFIPLHQFLGWAKCQAY